MMTDYDSIGNASVTMLVNVTPYSDDLAVTGSLNMTNGTIQSTIAPYENFYNSAQFTTGLVCYPILCVLGITGNALILIVLATKKMQTSTNVILGALSVSDMFKLLNDFLYFLTILLLRFYEAKGKVMLAYLYPYAHYIFNMTACTSAWLTISVAVERYVMVCHATRAKSLCTIARSRVISATVFIIVGAILLPSALRYRTVSRWSNVTNSSHMDVEVTELWKDAKFVASYNRMQNLLRSVIPFFLLIIMNAFIINALRKTRANKKMAQRNRITTMLIIVILVFLICIAPDAIMGLMGLGYIEAKDFLVKGVREITDMLLAVNASVNFIIYIAFNSSFRDQFCDQFCKKCRTKSCINGTKNIKKESEAKYKKLSDKTVNGSHYSKSSPNSSEIQDQPTTLKDNATVTSNV
ncbi:unnamed protein product [Owenia fusiformis]|uniref:Uncharacterized protein n=1 Tax=Owenia fusiformis TaxID=6347 RepID=A0A8J1TS04_OWEFU|nr:unnamed protein product [Owenia fusiformis]